MKDCPHCGQSLGGGAAAAGGDQADLIAKIVAAITGQGGGAAPAAAPELAGGQTEDIDTKARDSALDDLIEKTGQWGASPLGKKKDDEELPAA